MYLIWMFFCNIFVKPNVFIQDRIPWFTCDVNVYTEHGCMQLYKILLYFICSSYEFLMHFLCISYAFLMHFLCTSYALHKSAKELHVILLKVHVLLMHFYEVHKKCIKSA